MRIPNIIPLRVLLVLFVFGFCSQILASTRILVPKVKKGRSLEVPILKEKNRKSDEYRKMKTDESLIAVKRKGMYWQVKFEEKLAYVSVKLVKVKKSESNGLMNVITREVQKSRNENDPATARARSTVMGVRGLADSGNMKFAGNVRPNLRLVYAMETFLVPKKDIDALSQMVEDEVDKLYGKIIFLYFLLETYI